MTVTMCLPLGLTVAELTRSWIAPTSKRSLHESTLMKRMMPSWLNTPRHYNKTHQTHLFSNDVTQCCSTVEECRCTHGSGASVERIGDELELSHWRHFAGKFDDAEGLAWVERPNVKEARPTATNKRLAITISTNTMNERWQFWMGEMLVIVYNREQAKVLKAGRSPSGVLSWNLHCRVSASHANTVSSLNAVRIVLLRGRKNTCNRKNVEIFTVNFLWIKKITEKSKILKFQLNKTKLYFSFHRILHYKTVCKSQIMQLLWTEVTRFSFQLPLLKYSAPLLNS